MLITSESIVDVFKMLLSNYLMTVNERYSHRAQAVVTFYRLKCLLTDVKFRGILNWL